MSPVLSIQWHITNACDERCTTCYLFSSERGRAMAKRYRHVPFDRAVSIIDNLCRSCAQLHARPRIAVTGGDPLRHPRLWDILSVCAERDIRVQLMGNPRSLTEDTVHMLVGHGINRFQLSLDGMREIHDALRSPGSFDATTVAIELLKKHGIRVGIMSTVSKLNAGDIPSLIRHVVTLGVGSYAFARYCPTHQDTDHLFTPLEYRAFLSEVWDVYTELVDSGTDFPLKDHLWSLFLFEKGLFKPEPTDGVIVDGCGMGASHLTVLADGTVYACRRFDSPVGRVPEQSFADIFNGSALEEYRQHDKMVKCRTCELLTYCRGCPAVAAGATDRWYNADPQCWK